MMARRTKGIGYTLRSFGVGRALFCLMSLFLLFLIIRNSQAAVDHMTRGMKLCATSVIPSLFPFMVVSEMLVRSGAGEAVGRLLRKPARLLFGVGEGSACAILLGALCGFPIGTRVAVSFYKERQITQDELLRVLCVSNNPSSAFVISAVGLTLFGSRGFGVALYATTLASAFLVGIGANVIFGGKRGSEDVVLPERKSAGFRVSDVTSSISASAAGMLNVCAFVIFFSAFLGTLEHTLSAFDVTQSVRAILFSFFELTGGAAAASSIKEVGTAASVAAFAMGWSGMSVHFQIMSLCDGIEVSFRRYFIAKLCQGLLNVVLIKLYLAVFGKGIVFAPRSVSAFDVVKGEYSVSVVLILCAFAAGIFLLVSDRRSAKKRN